MPGNPEEMVSYKWKRNIPRLLYQLTLPKEYVPKVNFLKGSVGSLGVGRGVRVNLLEMGNVDI